MRTGYKLLQVHEGKWYRDVPPEDSHFLPYFYDKKRKETFISSLDFHFDRGYYEHEEYLHSVIKYLNRFQLDQIKIALKYFVRYYS